MIEAMSYVPLWCKSNFSFLEGASHPDELVEEAHRFGLPALALTDRDGVYGVVRAVYRAHKEELDAAPSEEARWRRLCELNVMAQVHAVREADIVRQAWRKDQPVMVHGWIYDLKEGLLRDLDLN
jgi:DNA polymerase III alpha subunit